MGKNRRPVHIGTSGWHYRDWEDVFYPKGTRTGEYLPYYAKHLYTTEINNTFYQLPGEKTLRKWHDTTPDNFIFSVKASRYITHIKRLQNADKPLNTFLERAKLLGERLGPVLFQLPPGMDYNPERLEAFLKVLPPGYRYVFEFRHPEWFREDIMYLLAKQGAAFCIYDLDGRESPKTVTAPHVYIRLHGPDGPYQGNYSEPAIRDWAEAVLNWAEQGREVFCYFDNDECGYGVYNAMRLQELVSQAAPVTR